MLSREFSSPYLTLPTPSPAPFSWCTHARQRTRMMVFCYFPQCLQPSSSNEIFFYLWIILAALLASTAPCRPVRLMKRVCLLDLMEAVDSRDEISAFLRKRHSTSASTQDEVEWRARINLYGEQISYGRAMFCTTKLLMQTCIIKQPTIAAGPKLIVISGAFFAPGRISIV